MSVYDETLTKLLMEYEDLCRSHTELLAALKGMLNAHDTGEFSAAKKATRAIANAEKLLK